MTTPTTIIRALSGFLRQPSPPPAGNEPAPKAAAPPKGALTVLAPLDLLTQRRDLVRRIESLAGATRTHFDDFYWPALLRFAGWSQQFPASESHHHAYPGGLLDHTLEVAASALRTRQGYLLPPSAPPEEAVLRKGLWTYALFTLALLHDAVKPAVDQEVTVLSEDGGDWIWNPWQGDLGSDPKARHYRIRFRPGRDYRVHQRAALLLAPRLLGAEGLAWLASDPAVLSAWMAGAMGDTAQAGPLAEILAKADSESVAAALGNAPTGPVGSPRPGLAHALPAALRHLIDTGEWPLNRRGAIGWRSGDSLWLVSKAAMDGLRGYLLRLGVGGVPTENTRLFDLLQDAGLLEPTAEGRAVWRVVVQAGVHSDELTVIQVRLPALYVDLDAAPGTFDGRIEPVIPARPAGPIPAASSAQAEAISAAPMAAASAPRLTGDRLLTEQPVETLGRRFLQWLIDGLRDGRLAYNSPKARVHVVPEGVLLASPGIFKDCVADLGEVSFEATQRSFLKLKLHCTTTAGLNVHQYAVVGSGSRISGLVIAESRLLFENVVPDPNPKLTRQ
jgi:integrating conjugative element relaxase (TIGR03760 family)